LTLAWEPRRDSEAGKPYAVIVVDEHIFRLDVFVYESTAMDLSECCRQSDSNTQDSGEIERLSLVPLKNPIQRLTTRVFEYEDRPSFMTTESQRPDCPSGIEFSGE
jgi:hypothetical protein